MARLDFYQLGENPEAEAVRVRNLYCSPGVDDAIRSEFATTVEAYRNLSISGIAQRIKERYATTSSPASGMIAAHEGNDVGMAVWGSKDFRNVEDNESTEGINVSAWLLSVYRGKGFGNEIIERATLHARRQAELSGKTVWTSIVPDNIASRIACERAGFIMAGKQGDKPDRLLYLLANSQRT